MRILLDENFPIQLYRRLQESGHAAEHIIALGLRGISDEQFAGGWRSTPTCCSSPRTRSSQTFRPKPPPPS